MLVGILGGLSVASTTAEAADLQPVVKAPYALYDPLPPAVDGFNGKALAFGGSYSNRSLYGVGGSVSIPLAGQLGVQIDGIGGSFDNRGMGAVGAHFFWRDPRRGLIGLYVAHTHWEQFGGVHVNQFAAEGEIYYGPLTVQGVIGVESGNAVSTGAGTTIVVVPQAGAAAGVRTVSTLVEGFDVRTRFFDKINIAYYPLPDLKVFIGHRYLGGQHAMAAGGEYALPFPGETRASLFAEARVGSGDFHGAWGGLKVYFGRHDKSLIRRHREDDPIEWTPEGLGSITNSAGGPSVATSSTTKFCSSGTLRSNGTCQLVMPP